MKSKYKYINFKSYKINIRWILPIFIFIFVLSYCGVKHVKNLTYDNVYTNIAELNKQVTAQLNLSITNQKEFIEMMADSINKGYQKTTQEIFDSFSNDLAEHNFTRLVVLDKNGNGISNDGFEVKNYSNIDEFFKSDEVYLSENRPSLVTDNQVNIYSKTCIIDGEEKVLMATIYTTDYHSILLKSLYDGKGKTFLVNNNCSILLDSSDKMPNESITLYDYIQNKYHLSKEEDINKLKDMETKIKELKSGTFDLKLGDTTYFFNYNNVNINNWYVVSAVPTDTIAKELNQFLALTFGTSIFVNCIILGICLYVDISNQKKNRSLYKVAYIDPVTYLGNELYFKTNALDFLKNKMGNKYILSIDINKFKALNTIYGYDFCNKLLEAFGEKLKATLPSENITCRMYGDIFCAVFTYANNIKIVLDKVLREVSDIEINDNNIHLNLSIGIYKLHKDDSDINVLLDKVYISRSKVKGQYNTNYYIFDEMLENKLLEEQKIESCMYDALKNKEFKIIYQPKFFTSGEKLAGAEALVRWYKDNEIIFPNKFIPLFEKNKFIIKLDLYIFEQVCKDLSEWDQKYGFTPTISVNISKEHFVDKRFINDYIRISNKYNIDRSKIDLEITESATIDKNIDIISILNTIKEYGFTISIDDFGTGYSSLSMLQNMPIDIIKIDKVFVDNADLSSNRNIINYIMILSKRLGVKTIVEGVETREQVEFMRKLQCDMIQGYYYSKPITKEEFEKMFK